MIFKCYLKTESYNEFIGIKHFSKMPKVGSLILDETGEFYTVYSITRSVGFMLGSVVFEH